MKGQSKEKGKPRASNTQAKRKQKGTERKRLAPSRRRNMRTDKKDEVFFRELAAGTTIKGAAAKAGYQREACYRWRESDEDFARLWDEALEEGTQQLEEEAIRRAKGYVETRIAKDGTPYEIRQHSDVLLIFLLKARRPDVYREKIDINEDRRTFVHVNLLPVIGGRVVSEEEMLSQLPAHCRPPALPSGGEEDDG